MNQSFSNLLTPNTLGLVCPGCSGVKFKTFWQHFSNGTKRVRAECAQCGQFLRHLPQDRKVEMSNPPPQQRAGHPAYSPAPPDWPYLGFLRQADGAWKPIAMSLTLAGCWDTILHSWERGDLLIYQVNPTSLPKELARSKTAKESPQLFEKKESNHESN